MELKKGRTEKQKSNVSFLGVWKLSAKLCMVKKRKTVSFRFPTAKHAVIADWRSYLCTSSFYLLQRSPKKIRPAWLFVSYILFQGCIPCVVPENLSMFSRLMKHPQSRNHANMWILSKTNYIYIYIYVYTYMYIYIYTYIYIYLYI